MEWLNSNPYDEPCGLRFVRSLGTLAGVKRRSVGYRIAVAVRSSTPRSEPFFLKWLPARRLERRDCSQVSAFNYPPRPAGAPMSGS
jgi:hypothetical protein